MTITTTQKLIKIGTSRGVTLPAKELRLAGIRDGDEVEVIVRKKTIDEATTQEVIDAANSILQRYKQDFKNLAQR